MISVQVLGSGQRNRRDGVTAALGVNSSWLQRSRETKVSVLGRIAPAVDYWYSAKKRERCSLCCGIQMSELSMGRSQLQKRKGDEQPSESAHS